MLAAFLFDSPGIVPVLVFAVDLTFTQYSYTDPINIEKL